MKTFSLEFLANHINAEIYLPHYLNPQISNLKSLEEADIRSISLFHSKKFLSSFHKTKASACIIHPTLLQYNTLNIPLLIHKNPYKAYALLSQLFINTNHLAEFRAPTAYIAPTAQIGQNCQIEHSAYIGDEVVIGNNCQIGVNSYIGKGVIIGNNCKIENQVSIENTQIGSNVVIHPGARIGQDGFGFASDADGHYTIAHQGIVIIGNHVHIGSNTCIDRGSLENTEINDHVRLDNLIQIGHNVKIGRGTVIAAQSGIAGSTSVGEFVEIGGQTGINGHITIGSGSKILGKSQVTKSVGPGLRIGGYPATLDKEWHRQIVYLRRMSQKNKKEE